MYNKVTIVVVTWATILSMNFNSFDALLAEAGDEFDSFADSSRLPQFMLSAPPPQTTLLPDIHPLRSEELTAAGIRLTSPSEFGGTTTMRKRARNNTSSPGDLRLSSRSRSPAKPPTKRIDFPFQVKDANSAIDNPASRTSPAISLPYASAELAKKMSSDAAKLIGADALKEVMFSLFSDRPRVALRGMHIIMHEIYGSFDSSKPFETGYLAQPLDYIYPSQWDAEGDAPNSQFYDTSNLAAVSTSQWYKHSAAEIANGGLYKQRCFTVDIDPASYATQQAQFVTMFNRLPANQKHLFKEKAIKLQDDIHKSAFNGFLNMLQRELPNGFDLIDESSSRTSWNYAEQSSRKLSAFVRQDHDIMADTEALQGITESAAARSAIHWFLRNEWNGYDAMVGQFPLLKLDVQGSEFQSSYKKHYFIEVIGFATQEEWQATQHDFTFSNSRKRAWESWLNRVSMQKSIEVSVFGFFAMQIHALPPFATVNLSLLENASLYYDHEEAMQEPFIGAVIPANFDTDLYRRVSQLNQLDSYLYVSIRYIYDRLPSNLLTWIGVASTHAFLDRTGYGMPRFMIDNALNPFFTSTPFKRDEFSWAENIAKTLGAGGFGQVLSIRYQASNSTVGETNVGMMKHHTMIINMLRHQRDILRTRNFMSYTASESGEKDYGRLVVKRSLERIAFETVDGKGRVIDFTDASETLALYDEALAIVSTLGARTTNPDEEEPWFQVASNVDQAAILNAYSGYNADVRINVAVKFAQTYFANRREYVIGQLCHHKRFPTTFIRVEGDNVSIDKEEVGWRDENLVVSVNVDSLADVTGSVITVPSRKVIFTTDFQTPNELAIELPQSLAELLQAGGSFEVAYNTYNIMKVYGAGYDNQFMFSVMPIAGKATLWEHLHQSIKIEDANRQQYVAREQVAYANFVRKVNARNDARYQPPDAYTDRMLSSVELIKILKDALSGIRFLNSKALMHRDIKPENILIDDLRQGFLTDFGLLIPYGQPFQGIYGTQGYYPKHILGAKPLDLNCIEPTIDTFAFGTVVEDVLDTPYGETLFAQYAGTTFNNQDLTILQSSNTIQTADFVYLYQYSEYRPGDAVTPQSQRPLSVDDATIMIETLRSVKNLLLDEQYFYAMLRSSTLEPNIATRNINEHAVANRLLLAQVTLDTLYDYLMGYSKVEPLPSDD